MKLINCFLVLMLLFFLGCSNSNDIDAMVAKEWEKCTDKNNCSIDFSNLIKPEWDTMVFYSSANSLEDINKDLGFELNQFTDIGDRVIFLNKDKVVYYKEWFPYPDEPVKGIVFVNDSNKFKVAKSNSVFKVRKVGEAYYLELKK